MANTKVTATPLQGFRVLQSEDRPDAAVLELQVRGATQFFLVPRDKLKDLASHMNTAADAMNAEAKPQTFS